MAHWVPEEADKDRIVNLLRACQLVMLSRLCVLLQTETGTGQKRVRSAGVRIQQKTRFGE